MSKHASRWVMMMSSAFLAGGCAGTAVEESWDVCMCTVLAVK